MTNKTKLAEEQVLNYIYHENKLFWQYSNRIVDDMFDRYRPIWDAFKALLIENKKPSVINIHPSVKDFYTYDELVKLFSSINYETELIQWIEFLENNQKRKLALNTVRELNRMLLSEDISGVEGYIHNQLLAFTDKKTEDKTIREYIQENLSHIERIQTGTQIFGIETGIQEYDRWTGGLQLTDLNIIAGYTSQGKTAASLTIAYNASVYGKVNVAFFTLEMSTLQIVARLLAIDTGIGSKDILSGNVDLNYLNKKLGAITDNKIHIPSGRSSSLDFIIGMMRFYIIKYDCKVFFIDYLQLITHFKKGFNNELIIADICRTLKNFAKENNVCVNLLSQLSRGDRSNGRPKLSDLRGSGQIEEAADNVIFVYRPEIYGLTQVDFGGEQIDTTGKVFLMLDKSRNSGVNKFTLSFIPEIPTIENKHSKQIANVNF